jgi:hypothetical protein
VKAHARLDSDKGVVPLAELPIGEHALLLLGNDAGLLVAKAEHPTRSKTWAPVSSGFWWPLRDRGLTWLTHGHILLVRRRGGGHCQVLTHAHDKLGELSIFALGVSFRFVCRPEPGKLWTNNPMMLPPDSEKVRA